MGPRISWPFPGRDGLACRAILRAGPTPVVVGSSAGRWHPSALRLGASLLAEQGSLTRLIGKHGFRTVPDIGGLDQTPVKLPVLPLGQLLCQAESIPTAIIARRALLVRHRAIVQ